MQRDWHRVDDSEALRREVERIGAGPLALDSEADSFHHYREKVCLLQLSFGGRDVLVDPLGPVDLTLLEPPLADPGLRKILHGADYDVRLLHRELGLELRGLFDTMVAARLVGERKFGLSALLARHFSVELDKKHQRADWSRRPLTAEMERYAVDDTRYLERLAAILEARLQQLGRTAWAEEEFRRLEEVRWEVERGPDQVLARIKGVQALDRRELAIARELVVLREQASQRRDLPVFRVMRDEVLLRLVAAQPRWVEHLREIDGLARAWRFGPGGKQILAAVARGRAVPRPRLPKLPEPSRRRRDAEAERRLKRLCRRRDRIAAELDLEPSVVGSRAVLERALEAIAAGRAPGTADGLRRWQLELLGPALSAVAG